MAWFICLVIIYGSSSNVVFHCTVRNRAVRGTKSMRKHVLVLSMVPPYAKACSLITLSGAPSYAKSYNGAVSGTKAEQSFHSVVHGEIVIFNTHDNGYSDLSCPITQKLCQFPAHFQKSTSLPKKQVRKMNRDPAP